jgi:glycosyltransferase involved in cell wall biosynthesis
VRILYLASDPVPAPKGASVRIRTTIESLRAQGHEVALFTMASSAEPLEGHDTVKLPDGNFLSRMMIMRRAAALWLSARRADLVVFRGIWEGLPAIAWARRSRAKVVYEAHGFPSMELSYHYPALRSADGVLRKIVAEEQVALRASDRVVTPSATGARFLMMRGVDPARIDVIPNAVDVELFSPSGAPLDAAPPHRIVYVGTLSPWQGLAVLLEALARLGRRSSLELHVVGPAKSAWRRALRAQARRLRVHHALVLSDAMEQRDLVSVLRTAQVCVAPLLADPRNVVQGCCPIKLLEYMAAGRPILSTAIGPVEELVTHAVTAHRVSPGSAPALSDGIAWMLGHPAEREAMGARAREVASGRYTRAHLDRRLADLVARLG